ncbi:Nn.00g059270.m01.CDS01 [Neocucurbitaria sp. VM-36]
MMSGTRRNACLSCRKRKLKCDRQQPCTNCIARSVECKQQSLPPLNRGTNTKELPVASDTSAIANILSRLDRIEACINLTKENGSDSLVSTPIEGDLNTIRNGIPSLASIAQALPIKIPTQSNLSDREIQPLKVSANDNILRHALMHNVLISISANSLLQHYSDSYQIQLPPKWEVFRSFQLYNDYIGQFQHIIYEPHFRSLTEEVYYQVTNVSTTTAPRGLALILSIIAIASILEPLQGSLDTVIPILKDRLKICAVYIRSSMDCLEQHRRRMDHTLENVQAMLILQFLINLIESCSPRYRALSSEAIVVSHSIGLHIIDSKVAKGHMTQNGTDSITQEMKRRVWWYLTAMDWLVSMAQGPSEAVYLVQPKFTASNIPKHINDDDLGNPNIQERPLTEPTTMSYVLHRLKVAEIVRCILDVIPHDPSDATYEMILSLDSKFDSLSQDLPAFFRVENADSDETKVIVRSHPYIPIQRLMLNMTINIFRCKLHFPYLAGNPSKSLHAFSRDASLKAARNLLSAHRDMISSEISNSADFMKIQGTVFHIFMGALVLATDLCCNQPRGADRDRQSSELTMVLHQLDGIKQHSQIAAEFLKHLTQLLVKYGVWSPDTTVSPITENGSEPSMDRFGNGQMDLYEFTGPFPFDDLWEMYVEQPSALDILDIM